MSRFGALGKLGGRKADKAQATAPAGDAAAEQGLGGSLKRASDLIDEVVRAAERAAEQISGDAESRGDGRASVIDRERVAAELMKSLAERTDKLRSEAQELARILDRAAPLVAQADDATAGPPARQEPPPPTPPAAVPPSSAEVAPSPPASGSSGVSVPPPSIGPPAPPSGPAASVSSVAAPAPVIAQEPLAQAEAFVQPEPLARAEPVEPLTRVEPVATTTPLEAPAAATAADAEVEPLLAAPLEPLGRSGRKTSPHPSEGIRLLATQMAVAGSSHHEIEERLRREFGVSDADEIIAEVFGARE